MHSLAIERKYNVDCVNSFRVVIRGLRQWTVPERSYKQTTEEEKLSRSKYFFQK